MTDRPPTPYPTPGVVLLNLGGPDSLAAVRPFLLNIFNDPDILPLPRPLRGLLARRIVRRRAPIARRHYEAIGGRSPLLGNMEAQTRGLEQAFAARGVPLPVAIGNRYWRPFATDALEALAARGAERVIALPMYPQFSRTTTASSLADLTRALARHPRFSALPRPLAVLSSYETLPGLVSYWAQAIRRALTGTPEVRAAPGDLRSSAVLFSAHSLPLAIVDGGDPYPGHIQATVAAIVATLGLQVETALSYQSRVGRIPWLAPTTVETLLRLGESGVTRLVVAPISFTADCSETDYELAIEYAPAARAAGIRSYTVIPAPNSDPGFIGSLADATLAVWRVATGRRVTSARDDCDDS